MRRMGRFPMVSPNPLLPENRERTRQAVLDSGADLGIAWDGAMIAVSV